MKKSFALLAAVIMLLGIACATAETVEVQQATVDFDVTMVIPEGFTMMEQRVNDTLCIDVLADDPEANPTYFMTIAFSEEYEGRTISEMSDEEQNALVEKISTDNFEKAILSSYITTGGTLVYVLDEDDSESDYALAFTVYKGYFIQMFVERFNFDTLSGQDIQRAIDLLSGMEFVDK